MPRSSTFHTSLQRARLILGVEKGSFAVLVLLTMFFLVAQFYAGFAISLLGYFIARWMTKKDDSFVGAFAKYLQEEHTFDATPRPSDSKNRPKGWGRGVPL